MLSRQGTLEIAVHRSRSNTISPGLTATSLVEPMLAVPAAKDAFMARIPLQRPGTPSNMAAGALFLTRDRQLRHRRQPVRGWRLEADRVPGPPTGED